MYQDDDGHPNDPAERISNFSDEGGLRRPPHLKGWRKAWWWFDFIVLVNLARLRFIAILVVIGVDHHALGHAGCLLRQVDASRRRYGCRRR